MPLIKNKKINKEAQLWTSVYHLALFHNATLEYDVLFCQHLKTASQLAFKTNLPNYHILRNDAAATQWHEIAAMYIVKPPIKQR